MKKLIEAYKIVEDYNSKENGLEEIAKMFGEYSGQTIPLNVIENFKFTGLLPTDFIFSSYLTSKGFKNAYQINQKITSNKETKLSAENYLKCKNIFVGTYVSNEKASEGHFKLTELMEEYAQSVNQSTVPITDDEIHNKAWKR